MRQSDLISFLHYIISGCAVLEFIRNKKEALNTCSIKQSYYFTHISTSFWWTYKFYYSVCHSGQHCTENGSKTIIFKEVWPLFLQCAFELQLLAFEMFRREDNHGLFFACVLFWNGICLYIPDRSEKWRCKISALFWAILCPASVSFVCSIH